MKKFLALMMCLVLAFCLVPATAEQANSVVVAELLYDGAWVRFEDGFEFYLPANWYQVEEIPQEWAEGGIFYVACSEDLAYTCCLGWQPLPNEYTIEEVLGEFLPTYPDAQVIEVNGVHLVAFTDPEMNQMTCVALDAAEPGIYCFVFSPADDEDFQLLAALIASTIRNY